MSQDANAGGTSWESLFTQTGLPIEEAGGRQGFPAVPGGVHHEVNNAMGVPVHAGEPAGIESQPLSHRGIDLGRGQ